MKRFLTAILILATLLCIGCTKTEEDAPAGMIAASGEYVDYNLYVPEKWTVETSTGVITAKYSDSILVNVSMMASRAPDEITTPEQYWDNYREQFSTVYSDFELISDEATLLDGRAAHKYVYTGKIGGVSAKYAQTVCIKDGTVYLFTYTADPEKYDQYEPDTAKMLEHFSFR